jgi:hypothetical protein
MELRGLFWVALVAVSCDGGAELFAFQTNMWGYITSSHAVRL